MAITHHKVGDALREVAKILETISQTARLDAELLMAHALQVSRSDLLLHHMESLVPDEFSALVKRRRTHEPIAYITGQCEFWSLPLKVTRDVLIPRADSETLIEAARAYFFKNYRRPTTIADFGTGSGALLLSALSEWPEARGIGIDSSKAALLVAEYNSQALGIQGRASLHLADWSDPDFTACMLALGAPFDLILCNPPYVEAGIQLAPQVQDYEPHKALFAGRDGLADYRKIMPLIPALLKPGGIIIFELGAGQHDAVKSLACDQGLDSYSQRDLGGHARALICFKAVNL